MSRKTPNVGTKQQKPQNHPYVQKDKPKTKKISQEHLKKILTTIGLIVLSIVYLSISFLPVYYIMVILCSALNVASSIPDRCWLWPLRIFNF